MPRVRKTQARSGPRARPARPGGVQAAAEQRGDGEGKGHREADVAHIEQRRVEDQADILQQRVEVAAVDRELRQRAGERVGGDDHEQQEAGADHAHHRQHARQRILRQFAAAEHRHRQGPAAEQQRPQQQRTFVRAPGGGDAVIHR